MKLLAAFFLLFALSATGVMAKAVNCDKSTENCKMTETSAYLKCLQNRRTKRDICPYANTAVYAVAPSPTVVQCTTPDCSPNIIYDNCINSCTGSCNGYTCQDRCDNACKSEQVLTYPQTQTIIQKETAKPSVISPNVTTTIHLTNIINNTNHINVPTSINNTNVNNLDLGSNSSSYQQMMAASNRKCCVVVQPRVCHSINGTSGGTRCVHKRHHTCGPQCESATMHAQVRQPCEGPVKDCPPSIVYVPQPQPRCNYVPTWPYVSCGQQGMPNCEGCYDHYGYGFENFHAGSSPDCGGCYDDNINQGSMYRQGPYYRPGYYHMPPVEIAPYTAPIPCGQGCFGNQMIDPAFGAPSCSPYAGGCAPSSQYYNFATAYPPPMYAPPVYAPPIYAPPAYQQYYSPMQQYYAPYQQYYGQNQQYYLPQSYGPLFPYNLGTIFNNTLVNGTNFGTEDIIVNEKSSDVNKIIPEYRQFPQYNPLYSPYYVSMRDILNTQNNSTMMG